MFVGIQWWIMYDVLISPMSQWCCYFQKISLTNLISYSGHEVKVLGTVNVEASYKCDIEILSLLGFKDTGQDVFVNKLSNAF